jgi:hypothetical protein
MEAGITDHVWDLRNCCPIALALGPVIALIKMIETLRGSNKQRAAHPVALEPMQSRRSFIRRLGGRVCLK